RAFVGETVAVTLSVTNRKLLPLPGLRVDDYLPVELVFTDVTPEASHIPGLAFIRQHFSLSWFERAARTYHFDCRRRGLYIFPQLRLETGDPFGLFPVQAEIRQEDRLIIYPQVKPVAGLDLPAKTLFGPAVADRRMLEDPVYLRGVRPYQPQDSLRYIHWKATARTDALQTKMFEPTTAPAVVFLVNVATFSKSWRGIDPVLLERVVSVAASLCAYAVEQKLMVGLSANGTAYRSDQQLRVLPSRSPQQLTRLLEALASVRGIASSEFEPFLLRDSSRLPWEATLVVITAVVTPGLEEGLLRLKDAGRKLVLLSLAETPPRRIRGVLTYHLPGRQQDEAFHFTPVGGAPEDRPAKPEEAGP
ncbi:MAG: DUF58 domain-containing protein, partial [Anaerolineae bacterium]